MKKLILIIILLTAGMFAQESNIHLLYRGTNFQEDGGGLYALGGVGLRESGGLALTVSPPAPFTLSHTGAQVQNILDGTFTGDIIIPYQSKYYFNTDSSTSIGEYSDGYVSLIVDASARMVASSQGLRASTIWTSGMVMPTAATSTACGLVPYSGDTNTGIGWAAADTMSFISGGVNIMNIQPNGVILNEAGADLDFRVETNGEDSAFVIDGVMGVGFMETGMRVNTGSLGTTHTLSADSCYGMVLYVTAAVTITLPAIAEGMSITFITIGANAVSIDANDNDDIWLDGTQIGDGNKATNTSTTGDIIVFTYYSAVGWYAASNSWTDGGA